MASDASPDVDKNKKKPFSAWLKKVTNMKRSSSSKRAKKESASSSPAAKDDKAPIVNLPGHDETAPLQRIPSNGEHNPTSVTSQAPVLQLPPRDPAPTGSFVSFPTNEEVQHPSMNGESASHSGAPTLATNPDTLVSDGGQSKSATTSNAQAVSTISGGGAGSIFSSSNHSSRSLATTLTTVQSGAASTHLQNAPNTTASTPTSAHHPGHAHHPSQGSTYFSHQYPTTPLSAVPQHLQAPPTTSHLPTTYRSATANNLLTDNASILTLASSTHNANRRASLDTAASVRAIAPSSQWGGSRESLPLSVLSANAEAPSTHQGGRPSVGGLTSGDMGGFSAPVLTSERNSVYRSTDASSLRTRETDGASMRGAPDAASMRSGHGGHGRNDSIAGSIGGVASSTREPVSVD